MSVIYAIDFDGCLCEDEYPNIGKANTELINWILDRKEGGDKIILWTCRTGNHLQLAIQWCLSNGIYFDAINDDVADEKQFYPNSGNRKIFADIYIDDKNVNYCCIKGDLYGKTIDETFRTARNAAAARRARLDAKRAINHKQEDIKPMEQDIRTKRARKRSVNKRVLPSANKRVR